MDQGQVTDAVLPGQPELGLSEIEMPRLGELQLPGDSLQMPQLSPVQPPSEGKTTLYKLFLAHLQF